MNTKIEELAKPFPAEDIEWRVGSTNRDKDKGIALAYITARAAMNRLDEVLGPENWTDTYSPIPGPTGDTKGYLCTISIRLGDEWVSKQDGADESNMESIKGGLSDAFKRSAVKWGIGRYLYNLPIVWVPLESYGNSYKLAMTPQLPAWALPEGAVQAPTKAANVSKPRASSVQNEKNAHGDKYPECIVPPRPTEEDADHQIFIAMIREGILAAMEQRQGRGVTENANKFAHILLQQAVPDQEQRHLFCKDLFKVDSWSDVSSGEIGGFLDWLSPVRHENPDGGKPTYSIPGETNNLIQRALSR